MSKNILKYLQRKRKERLYTQWVERSGLPPKEVPSDLLGEQPADETELASGEIPREKLPEYTALADIDSGIVRLPIRYILFGLSIIAFLLVALSVLITILIMR
jgi:hypothetical protein